jgi:hypothetical protein
MPPSTHEDECDGWMRCVRDEDDDDGRKGRLHPECCNKLLDAERRESPQAKGEETRMGLFLEPSMGPRNREKREHRAQEASDT